MIAVTRPTRAAPSRGRRGGVVGKRNSIRSLPIFKWYSRSGPVTMFRAWIRSEARSKRIWLDAAQGQVRYASKAVERSVVVPGTASPIERPAAFLLFGRVYVARKSD